MIDAQTTVNPEVVYGIVKYTAGKMAMALCESVGMECIWTRTFSVYGSGDSDTSLIMYTIDKLLKGEKTIFTKFIPKFSFVEGVTETIGWYRHWKSEEER